MHSLLAKHMIMHHAETQFKKSVSDRNLPPSSLLYMTHFGLFSFVISKVMYQTSFAV